jgi:hypothetical protein
VDTAAMQLVQTPDRPLTDRASARTLDGSMQLAPENRNNSFFAILGARVFAR